ncbi:MAG: hypothetical protein VYA34_17385 [Myxococcota bacterium]|nr:hypothetical protein [Myxococcota bacterium]
MRGKLLRRAYFSVAALYLLLSSACAADILERLVFKTEVFNQQSTAQIDILWVIDNSSSMAPYQAAIGNSFEAFIANLLESSVDYHIGVISTDTHDGGKLHVGSQQTKFLTKDLGKDEAKNIFLENVKVGNTGSPIEKAFESAATAIGKGLTWRPDQSPAPTDTEFFRPNAALYIIMVSDEDDKSFGSVSYYRKLFESYKGAGNEAIISVSAIVGDPGVGCQVTTGGVSGAAAPGERYIDLAAQTGGIFASICDDFSETLKELSLSATGLQSRFELNARPNPQARVQCGDNSFNAFCVKVDNVIIEKTGSDRSIGWSYSTPDNAIVFGPKSVPNPQSQITVKYQEQR